MNESEVGFMLNFLYKMVVPWAKSNKIQIYTNKVLGRIANYIYPIYCKLKKIKFSETLASNICKYRVIISLTSFPARIDKVYLCINSLLRQSIRADKIILWLAETQFPNGKGVPQNLLNLIGENFEIKYCDDIKSYKKIFFVAQEFRGDIIITVDDDTLYPEDWLSKLIYTYIEYPNCVCCYRAHKIVLQNDKIAPYSKWIGLSPDEKGPDLRLVPIGVGGVLYPPTYFNNVEFNFEKIKELCPTTDDLWLKAIGIKNEFKAVKVDLNSKEWFTIISSQKQALMNTNVGKNINDISISNLQKYYKIKF